MHSSRYVRRIIHICEQHENYTQKNLCTSGFYQPYIVPVAISPGNSFRRGVAHGVSRQHRVSLQHVSMDLFCTHQSIAYTRAWGRGPQPKQTNPGLELISQICTGLKIPNPQKRAPRLTPDGCHSSNQFRRYFFLVPLKPSGQQLCGPNGSQSQKLAPRHTSDRCRSNNHFTHSSRATSHFFFFRTNRPAHSVRCNEFYVPSVTCLANLDHSCLPPPAPR